MRHYLKFLILFTGLSSLIHYNSNATHIVGAQMSYKNIGGNTFEFILNIYRDCEGIPVQPTYRIDYATLSCNIQGNFIVTMDPSLTKEVSPVCSSIPTICSGGVQDGIQEYTYKGTFMLPQACADWVFSWRECNRNHDITTISNPDAQCLYIETTLNSIVAPSNNSPTFNNPPFSLLCIDQINSVNPGTAEIDGDVMVFSAITPKTGKFKDVTYLSPYSSGNPISSASGYTVNSVTGDIVVTPTIVDEVTVVALKVSEYRNGVLIGSAIRDIQVITKNCNNNNPILSGIDKTTADTKTVCAGNQVCFEIFGSDIDPGQKLTMSWDEAIDTSRAKFTVSGDSISPKGRFCWNTIASDTGFHFFTVTLRDDFCPTTGITIKSYKIIVTPSPSISVSSPINIACNTTTSITPTVSGGTNPYLYKWNTGASTPSITAGSGTYTLVVTDSKGCKSSRQVEVKSGVSAVFTISKICSTKTVNFIDASTSLIGTINSWRWNFDEPSSGPANTSTLQNPSHSYANGGTYNVKLVVTDDTGCKDSIVKKVKICGTPIANFTTQDSCQNKLYIRIIDQSSAPICGIKKIAWQFGSLSGGYTSPPGPIYNPPGLVFPVVQPDTGWINLTYTITNEDSCVSTISKLVHVNEQPEINVIEDSYYFDCSKPDTILRSVVNPNKGKPPFTVRWNNGTIGLNNPVNSIGIYVATVTDANGCTHADFIEIGDPLIPEFTNDPYCELSDLVQFRDATFSHWGAVQWDWNFGDGTSFSTTNPALRNPTHIYATQGLYQVTLTVRDSKGCIDMATHSFVFELPDNHFVVEPSPFCIGQQLKLESPRGLYIDNLTWSLGNGDTIRGSQPDFTRFPSLPNPPSYYYFDNTYVYPPGSEGNTYTVRLRMAYNNNQCFRNYSQDITIFPAFNVEIDSMIGKQCSGDTVQFFASLKVGSPVVSWDWEFRLQDNIPPYTKVLVSTSTDQNPKMTFDKGGNYFATLRARNADGCEEVITDYGFPIVKLPRPGFCIDNPCVSQQTKFFYFCSNFPEVSIDSVHWDFGDGSPGQNVQEPFHIYADSGLYQVKCEIFNTSFGCSNDTTMDTRIYLLPVPDFLANPICFGDIVNFQDLSTPSYLDTLERWSWEFGDGNTFSTTDTAFRNPSHLYTTTGTYQVSLYVESKISQCVDTITKPVTVFPNPTAGFSVTENELVLNRPILFFDESINGVKWLWHFGDGDSILITNPLDRNPQHTYEGVQKNVLVTQIVYNEFNCTDTISKMLDLSIHLILPSAFSPNNNGQNEKFKLIYKGIESLEEFSIFNRWGEKIFDAKGDLNAGWDGTYKNEDQPIGVYVYHVKAKDFTGQNISLSGKVTLIR